MIDFELPAEAKAIRERAGRFVQEVVLPAEEQGAKEGRSPREIVRELRPQAKAAGLWCPHMPTEWGGMGLTPLENALLQMELGMSRLGTAAVNSEGPDDATMLTLLEYGTEEQKQKYLPPLVAGEMRVAFSMTERAAGADATGMQTRAVRDGDHWVLNGEKWFSSGASGAGLAVILAKTDPEAPRHRQFSQFLVELPNPGYQIVRDIPTMAERPGREDGIGHAEILIKDLVVPAGNLLGGEGDGFSLGQHRLGYGRLRHGLRNIALAQRALDMAAGRVLERSTFGRPLSERQGVQWMLADCAGELYIARLMVLHIAYKMEHHLDMRQENSIAKVFLANMVHKVVDTALQLHGALGYSHDTPLAGWYTAVRAQRLVDGPDEVHRWTVGRNLLKAYQQHGTTAPACGGDLV
jgi:acyl-CoA dehydrogenase